MTVVACSGFPVPVSRYWREFEGVEISETELGIPGQGTVRRWLRESPDDFSFTLMAPKDIASAGFKKSAEGDKLIKAVGALCKSMKAHAVVFVAPQEFSCTRNTKSAVKKFVEALPARYPKVVIDLPGWDLETVRSVAELRKGVYAACDPLQQDIGTLSGDFAYMRLPGPAGHRSRYDDPSLEKIADACKASKAKKTICCFHNIDMHANARRVRELLGQI